MKRISLSRYRNQAAILLKEIRQGHPAAHKRTRQLDSFSSVTPIELQDQARLKHCLNVIAREQGFDHWATLKSDYEASAMAELASHYAKGYLNHWYATYAEARHHLDTHRGYLLPYGKNLLSYAKKELQYYVCNSAYIETFGFDPEAREWTLIGYDMVQPADPKARLILIDAWMEQRPESQIQGEQP